MTSHERILFTGATGFVGRHLLARLQQSDAEVYAVARHVPATALPRGAYVACDLSRTTDGKALQSIEAPVVVHLAALIPKNSMPQESLEENIVGNLTTTVNLLKHLRGVEYFVYVSTLDVYGLPEYLPIDEKHPTGPITYYGAAKLSAEKILQVYCREAGISLLILRLTQVYGAGEPVIKVIPQTIARVANGVPPVLHGDGSDTRDYIHVSDVVEVIVRALKARPTGTLNVASGTSRSIAEVVETILRVSGCGITPLSQPRVKPCVHFAFDVSRLRNELGDLPQKDFAQGIREQYEHYLRFRRHTA